MGLANYYRRFVKGFSAIAKALTKLTKVDQEWQWEDEQEQVFSRAQGEVDLGAHFETTYQGASFSAAYRLEHVGAWSGAHTGG